MRAIIVRRMRHQAGRRITKTIITRTECKIGKNEERNENSLQTSGTLSEILSEERLNLLHGLFFVYCSYLEEGEKFFITRNRINVKSYFHDFFPVDISLAIALYLYKHLVHFKDVTFQSNKRTN